jgi:hypothetical protein
LSLYDVWDVCSSNLAGSIVLCLVWTNASCTDQTRRKNDIQQYRYARTINEKSGGKQEIEPKNEYLLLNAPHKMTFNPEFEQKISKKEKRV